MKYPPTGMIHVSNALKLIEQNVPHLDTEKVHISGVVGRILTEDIIADMDLPPFDRSQMDGFAIRSEDVINTPADLEIVGESAAGSGWHNYLKAGQAVRIMTGAPVPAGADTVQKVELTSEADFRSAAAQFTKGKITIFESIAADKNIVRRGQEVQKGDLILSVGERINERTIATLAAFGYTEISVACRPRVSIFTTGTEVVEIGEIPGEDQIRNSNSSMLDALSRTVGATTTLLPSAADDLDVIKDVIASATQDSDIVVVTGGVSVGKYDLTKIALQELGAEIYFERLRLKPGKPAVFARLGPTVIFGLPGNPVSAAVTFYLFVRKTLLLMQNARETDLRKGRAVVIQNLKAARERDTYLPVKLDIDESASITATPVKWIGSSDFIGFGKSEALAFVPAGERVNAGDIVDILFL